MTPDQLHILQHALGMDAHGRGGGYRNHFVTGEGSDDHPDCVALVLLGFMAKRSGGPLTGGDDLFLVTDEGKLAVGRFSPPPPKLSRSKQRYQDWLGYDGDMSFIEYMRELTASATAAV